MGIKVSGWPATVFLFGYQADGCPTAFLYHIVDDRGTSLMAGPLLSVILIVDCKFLAKFRSMIHWNLYLKAFRASKSMNTCIKELLILVTITPLVISACKPDGDAGSMQPVEGYPFTTNMEEIKDILQYRGLDTISFRSGEIIADIGAGNGYIEAMLSMFHDSLTFYVQDIDASVCNKEAIDEVMDFYQKVNGRPFTNRFIVVNGTDRDTNLPDSPFDRILMIWTYAYLREPHVFIGDVRDNLKVNGLLYVINPTQDEDAYTNSIREKYGWNASPLEKQITDIIDCGFELVRITRNYNSDGFNQPYFMVFRKKNDPGIR